MDLRASSLKRMMSRQMISMPCSVSSQMALAAFSGLSNSTITRTLDPQCRCTDNVLTIWAASSASGSYNLHSHQWIGMEYMRGRKMEKKQVCFQRLLIPYPPPWEYFRHEHSEYITLCGCYRLLFLFGHLYLVGVRFGEDQTTKIIRTHVGLRLDYVFDF